MSLPGAETSGLMALSGKMMSGQVLGPRLEKLLIVYGGLCSVEPTEKQLVKVVARSAGERKPSVPSLPADQVTTTPAASQLSIAAHQRVSQSL